MPCDEVRLELALVVFVERPADDLLDLSVVQIDTRAEKGPAARMCHLE